MKHQPIKCERTASALALFEQNKALAYHIVRSKFGGDLAKGIGLTIEDLEQIGMAGPGGTLADAAKAIGQATQTARRIERKVKALLASRLRDLVAA